MKDLGVLKYFLGAEMARKKEDIFLCKRIYALDIISEARLLVWNLGGFMIEQNHWLAKVDDVVLEDLGKYRQLVGRLIYLTITHLELSHSVHVLSQFMQNSEGEHWEVALCVVCYLKSSIGLDILLKADCDLQLYANCDAN